MKFLIYLLNFIRLPIDFLLLTFHYAKGVGWLLIVTARKAFGSKTRRWPYGCFSQKTRSGHCACIPGRKYGNVFLFRALCPDVAREHGPIRQAYCTEKLQRTRRSWRPPLWRILGVGLFLVISWSMICYSIYRHLPATDTVDAKKADKFLKAAKTFIKENNYEKALLALDSAIRCQPDNGKIHFEHGRLLVRVHQLQEGYQALTRAIALDPSLWAAHFELAGLADRKGQYEAAIEHASAACKINPQESEACLLWASLLYKTDRTEEAMEILQETSSRLQTDANAVGQAASLYSAMNDEKTAKAFYQRALELDPNMIESRIGIAYILISESLWEPAKEQIDYVLSQNAQNKQALICRAELFLAKDESQNSINEYENIIALYPSDPQPKTRLASIFYKVGRTDEAAEQLQLVVSQHPNYPDALLNLGRIYLEKKRFRLAIANAGRISSKDQLRYVGAQEILARAFVAVEAHDNAIKACKNVLDSDPENFPIKILYAYSYQKLGKNDLALEHFTEAAKMNPDSPLPDAYLGILFAQRNEIELAIPRYKKVLKKHPDNKEIANNLALLLVERAKTSDLDEAYQLSEKLVQKHNDDTVITDTFGWVLYHQGKYQQAKRLFEQSISINPANPNPYYHLAKTFLEQDDLIKAEEFLTRALQLPTNFHGAEDAQKLMKEIQKKLQKKN